MDNMAQFITWALILALMGLTLYKTNAKYVDETLYPPDFYRPDGLLGPQLLEPYKPLLRSSGLIPEYSANRYGSPKLSISEDNNFPTNNSTTYSGLGSVAGVSAMPNERVALFQRAHVVWQAGTFDGPIYPMKARRTGLIRDDSIILINGTSGEITKSFGADRFYMPHGISADLMGNVWVTDAALHQVFRYPSERLARPIPVGKTDYDPDIVLGEPFIPGTDSKHFCKPTDVAVSSNGVVYISDGYCNSRVMVFSPSGQYLDEFGADEKMYTPHSLALVESLDLLCVADRDNERILCYSAGLRGDLRAGRLLLNIPYPFGRVFAIDHVKTGGDDMLVVVSISSQTGKPEIAILNLANQEITKLSSNDMVFPHDASVSFNQRSIYVVDANKAAKKKLYKFNITI